MQAVAEYQACVAAAKEVYDLAVAEAEKNLRAAMDVAPVPVKGETINVDKERLKQLEIVAAMVAKNPELFNMAKT